MDYQKAAIDFGMDFLRMTYGAVWSFTYLFLFDDAQITKALLGDENEHTFVAQAYLSPCKSFNET
jgi:hypothetical protein